MESARECRRAVVQEAALVLRDARECFGPCGRAHVVQGGALSSISDRILMGGGKAGGPVRKLVDQLLGAHTKVHGDHGLWVRILAAQLTAAALERRVPVRAFQKAMEEAVQLCEGKLLAVSRPVSLGDAGSLRKLVKSALGTKAGMACLNGRDLEHLSNCVLDAFVSSLNVDPAERTASPNVRVVAGLGVTVGDSRVLKQRVVLDLPLAPQHLDYLYRVQEWKRGWKVAVFENSIVLDGSEKQVGAKVYAESAQKWTIRDAQVALLKPFADALLEMKVDIVMCQRLINPWLKHHLFKSGVVCVERVSATHVAAVQELTKARVIGSISRLVEKTSEMEQMFGVLESISVMHLNGRHQLVIEGAKLKCQNISTLILFSPDSIALEELHFAIQRTLILLKGFLRFPSLCPGSGATEVILANSLRLSCPGSRLIKESWECLAEALELCATSLQPPPGAIGGITKYDVLFSIGSLEGSSSHHQQSPVGWDPIHECPVLYDLTAPPSEWFVADSVPAKLSALRLAVQASSVLLRVTGIVGPVSQLGCY